MLGGMSPLGLAALLWAASAAPAAAQAGVPADVMERFASGRGLPRAVPPGVPDASKDAYALALDVQDGCRSGEDDDAYRARAGVAAEKLGLTGNAAAQAAAAYTKCRPRAAGADSRPLDPAVEAAVVKRLLASGRLAADRRAALEARAARLVGLLGRQAEDSAAGGVSVAAAAPSGARPDAAAVAARLNAAAAPAKGLRTADVPGPERLHAMASEEVAPAPGVLDRAGSAITRSGPLVAKDLATIRAKLAAGEAPNVQAINEGNPSAVAEFYAWMKNVKDSDLPSISYGILDKGEIGRYDRGLLGKGSITINYFVRDAEPEARAAVTFHELYHYWDNEVAKNYYSNVSYGKIDPAHMHEHEYDAYLVTGLFWGQAKPDGASSKLSKYLDALPADRDAVRAMVDKSAGGHE